MKNVLNLTSFKAILSLAILFFAFNVNAQQVKGPNVTKVVYSSGEFKQVNSDTWQEIKYNETNRYTFKVTNKDEWSVYLFDKSRDISIQLDLYTKEIYIYWERPNRRVLYKIVKSSAPPESTHATIDTKKTYFIHSKHSGKVIDVAGVSSANGAKVYQWQLHKGKNQQWKFIPSGDGYYIIQSVHSGKVMDIPGSNKADGAVLQQWERHGGGNQQFKLIKNGDAYGIINRNSGKSLDVYQYSKDNGGSIVQWGWHGGPNQLWKLVPVPAAPPPATNTYKVEIDACHSSLDHTGTGNRITADFCIGSVKILSKFSDGVSDGCNGPDAVFSISTNKNINHVFVSINGEDAFFIDELRLYKNGKLMKHFGGDDGQGWCLSTDALDAKGSWKNNISASGNRCVPSIRFEY